MPFMKQKERLRREKVSKACVERNARNKVLKELRRPVLEPVGRRVVDLALLASCLWCEDCDIALSLRDMTEERQFGLASKFSVRCSRCLILKEVCTSSTVPDPDGSGRSLYAVNCKAALGCIDTGVGHEQFNKLFSAMNLPIIHANTMKLAEQRVGKTIVSIAQESCVEAIAEEKELTASSERIITSSQTPSSPSTSSFSMTPSTPRRPPGNEAPTPSRFRAAQEEEPVVITVKFDFGWDKRGSGFKYDSHSGRGSMIGDRTNKVLGYDVVSKYCHMCERGHKPENHVCPKNYDGSSKGMEPVSAVKLCLENPHLTAAGVRVGKFIGDRDSSTMAALKQKSTKPIQKIIDINHNTKSVNNALWKLKKGKHRFLTTEIIDYIKRCVSYAIKQNKGDVEVVRQQILNIADHTFGEHEKCGEWCKAKENPEEYVFRYLPQGKPFSCPIWREDLLSVLGSQANDAEQLAPAGSSLQNESFNHMCNTRAPKSRHYCGTNANLYRVSAAVCCKNLGANHLERVFKHAFLTPSCSNFREIIERRRQLKAKYQQKPEVKRRRLFKKSKSNWREAGANRTGLTYVSGMSTVMERAAAAASVSSWMPPPTSLLPGCKLVTVDIETTGFAATDEVIQLAAKCGDKEFSVYICPKKKIHPRATDSTGFRLIGGKLYRHDQCLTTIPVTEACQQFVSFLRECSNQVIIVGHNIISFDFPRILKLLRENGLAKDLPGLVFGMTDTQPLIKQGTVRKQDLLAKKYLTGEEWKPYVQGAHDAMIDCKLLDGLLKHFKVTEEKMKSNVVPVRDFLEKQAKKRRRKIIYLSYKYCLPMEFQRL